MFYPRWCSSLKAKINELQPMFNSWQLNKMSSNVGQCFVYETSYDAKH